MDHPRATDENFLFITADANAKSREARAHVTKTNSERRKQRYRLASKNRKSTILRWGTSHSPDDTNFSTVVRLQAERSKAHQITDDTKDGGDDEEAFELSSSDSSLSVNSTNARHDLIAHPQHRALPSPISGIRKGQSDPFNAAISPITPNIHELILLTREWYVYSKWPITADSRSKELSMYIWEHDIKNVIRHSATFHALLAVACAHKVRLRPSAYAPINSELLQQQILCMQTVRQALHENPVDLSLIFAMVLLGGASFYTDKATETVVHLHAVKRITDNLGTLTQLSQSVREEAALADSVTAWKLLSPPVFSVEEWDPGPWHEQEFGRKYYAQLKASGLSTDLNSPSDSKWARNTDWPDQCLRDSAVEFNHLMLVKRILWNVEEKQERVEVYKWLHLRRAAQKTRLLDLYLRQNATAETSTEFGSSGKRSLVKAACVLASYCHGLMMYAREPVVLHFPSKVVLDCLPSQYLDPETALHTTSSNMLLWLCFVACIAEQNSTPPLPVSDREYRRKFLILIQRKSLSSFEQIASILRSFLYDEILDDYLLAILDGTTLLDDMESEDSPEPLSTEIVANVMNCVLLAKTRHVT